MRMRARRGASPPSTGYGISTEWTIIDAQTAEPRPIADDALADLGSERTEWAHGLARHTLETKFQTAGMGVKGVRQPLRDAVVAMNRVLGAHGARLLGGGAHPFLDPAQVELRSGDPVFALCDRVFDCRRHGWVNSRTMHVDFPFADEAEFAELHEALRMVVPILPALCAASPLLDGRRSSYADARLIASKDRHRRIREVGGRLIPEALRTRDEYTRRVFRPIATAMAAHDVEGVLQPEWLNSRAMVPRFDRGTLTLREVDAQECPSANLALAAALVAVVEALADRRLDNRLPERGSVLRLASILEAVARDADQAVIDDAAYLRVFGVRRTQIRAGELWDHLLGRFSVPRVHEPAVQTLVGLGPLSRRITNELGRKRITRERLAELCLDLSECAADDSLYT